MTLMPEAIAAIYALGVLTGILLTTLTVHRHVQRNREILARMENRAGLDQAFLDLGRAALAEKIAVERAPGVFFPEPSVKVQERHLRAVDR